MTPATLDRFLGGRIGAEQPKRGFRAGHDTVLLAAAVPARAGERVLELGAGAGIASLCLAVRVPGVDVTGVEIDPELVALANANAARNGMAERVRFVVGDATGSALPQCEGVIFAHVFFNPPFHPEAGQVSPVDARDRAKRGDDLRAWWKVAVECAAADGTVTAIVRADRAGEIAGGEGALTVLPLAPREGESPKRAIVQMKKGVPASSRMLEPMILHRADGSPTEAAEAVLRHAQPIVP